MNPKFPLNTPLKTKDGRSAQITAYFPDQVWCYLGWVLSEDGVYNLCAWRKTGEWYSDALDLVPHKPEKKVLNLGWANVYLSKGELTCGNFCFTEEVAKQSAAKGIFARVHVSMEVEEGQGLTEEELKDRA